MTTIQGYPPQPDTRPHPFGHTSSYGPYNSLPPSPRTNPRGNIPSHDYRARVQGMPQQYAHPLQRTNSYPQDGSLKEEGHNRAKASEHMLRRKTPNGILTAAYDGTSVEQMEKPHAMKHILLPVTGAENLSFQGSAFSLGMKTELPLRSPGISLSLGPGYNPTPPAPNYPPLWGQDANFGLDAQWGKMGQQNLPQIDSMLNQIPMHHPNFQYPQLGGQFCGAMQPSLQSPLGPTASGEQGPYGPYWPNGTYIPYRPAALRDPRYQHAMPTTWPNHHYGGYSGNQIFNGSGTGLGGMPPPQNQYQISANYPQPTGLGIGAAQTYRMNDAYPPLHQHQPNLLQRHPGPNLNNPFRHTPAYPPSDLYTSLDSGQTTPVPAYNPVTSPLEQFGAHSSNAELRDKVFNWAHAVYVDLLAYLQQTRKAHRQMHGHSHPRPNIYPKPPRQPGANFSNSSRNNSQTNVYSANRENSSQSGSATLKESTSDGREHSHKRPSLSHSRSSSLWSQSGSESRPEHHRRSSWQQQQPQHSSLQQVPPPPDKYRTLRRTSGQSVANALMHNPYSADVSPNSAAMSAFEALSKLCQESSWEWIDGMLLGGCLSYALSDYQKSLSWNNRIIELDSDHVEATSNLAATLLALNRRQEAEQHWSRAVKLRPSYFEAVEHLVGLLCGDHRGKEAVKIIEYVERSLQYVKSGDTFKHSDGLSERGPSMSRSPCVSEVSSTDKAFFDFDGTESELAFKDLQDMPGADQPGFGSSGFAIPGSENGRILALVHAKGNMLYALGDNIGAAKAFENAVMIGAGRKIRGIGNLIKHILRAVSHDGSDPHSAQQLLASGDPILLPPDKALATARLCFPHHGELPGLKYVASDGMARKAAVSTMSNSLLSLAKIFQDGMATNSPKATAFQSNYGVREILALYYLSLALQPSPSTANNVGILLASVQQSVPSKQIPIQTSTPTPQIPGLAPGSGIALALAYYNYGLHLDGRHAHIYTNLGSLLKDIGQLNAAIRLYEQAVACDPNFDIALANLANAVKDQGRIADAITYYRRAVQASPDFAEAVCGLANALNSVCEWPGRGGIATDCGSRDRWHVNEKGMLLDARQPGASSSGWIKRVVDLVKKQLADGEDWGKGAIDTNFMADMLRQVSISDNSPQGIKEKEKDMTKTLQLWHGQKWEGARAIRLVERAIRRLCWQWYQDKYVRRKERSLSSYSRPQVPAALTVPAAPTVLPFHTFTCPMSAKQIRLISQRNGLRISCSTLKSPWLPSTVFPPPPPPNPYLKVGYVSSDFNNHPLAHLMQSVFGLHNPARVRAYCYATTVSDNSVHRQQIEREAPIFHDASSWSAEKLVKRIVDDGIHILINLNGYTRGARNEVFAARPAPIQMSFMGFAGTLGAEWCDYLLADETAVPPTTLRPWRRNVDLEDQLVDENSGGGHEDWVYGENIIYCRDTFFCCDHRQSAPDAHGHQLSWEEEQKRRWQMRKEIFPNLPDDVIILGNFNQLYKIEPTTFRTWLRILSQLPKAILWLLRFPDVGEHNLKQTAQLWAGPEVASRVLFTDVAPKHQHISRARVCDLFLDTPECNAHTTAADVLWSGTPLLTLPRYKYKMCSRMAASILKGALPKGIEGEKAAKELIASNEDEYEARAVSLGSSYVYEGYKVKGRLSELRKLLYEARWSSALFDTRRWVRDLEEAYDVAWGRWEKGEGGDIWLEKKGNSVKTSG